MYLNQYLLFGGDTYYPRGGWDDFIMSSPTMENAIAMVSQLEKKCEWYHVVDTKTNKIVWNNSKIPSAPKTNTEVLDAIQKDLISKGVDEKRAKKIIRNMSIEDLGCYYEENCK